MEVPESLLRNPAETSLNLMDSLKAFELLRLVILVTVHKLKKTSVSKSNQKSLPYYEAD